MHQIRFRLGLCPRPRWGSLQFFPDPLAGFKGPTSKGRGRHGRGGEGRTREAWRAGRERGREGREREKGRKGDRGRGGRGRTMGIAHPLFSA